TGRARAQLSRILPRVGRKLRDRVDGQGRLHRERSVPSTRWVTATRSLRGSNGTLRSCGTMTRLSTGVVRKVEPPGDDFTTAWPPSFQSFAAIFDDERLIKQL